MYKQIFIFFNLSLFGVRSETKRLEGRLSANETRSELYKVSYFFAATLAGVDTVSYFYPIKINLKIMAQQEDWLDYDEDESVKFIRNYLPQELKEKYSDDEMNYIIDLIYEFYETKGYMDESADDEVDIDEDELVGYVIENARKNGFADFVPEEIQFIVQGELAYCESLGMFD